MAPNAKAVREAAEKLLARNTRGYRQHLFTLQGAEQAKALIPLVMQVLADAAQMAATKPPARLPPPGPEDDLPLFSGRPEAPGGHLTTTRPPKPPAVPEKTPSKWSFDVVGDPLPFVVPQEWVDEWAADYGAEFVEGCLLQAKTWSKGDPTRRKTVRGMRRFLAAWIARQWDQGGGRRTTSGGAVGGARPTPSSFDRSKAVRAKILAEEAELPF